MTRVILVKRGVQGQRGATGVAAPETIAVAQNLEALLAVAGAIDEIEAVNENIAAVIAAPQAAADAADSAEEAANYVGSVRVTTNDTTPAVLNTKVTVSASLTKSTTSPGGDERLNLAVATGGITETLLADGAVTANKHGDASIAFTKLNSSAIASQAEAEAGSATNKLMTPQRVAQAIAALSPGANVQLFTASGTWTKPSNKASTSLVRIRLWGGGASGSHSGSGYNAGGGGGSYWERWLTLSEMAATETVTVGAGGNGVAYTAGQNGGDSSVGSLATAYGGTAGSTGNSNVGGAGGTPLGKSTAGTYTTPSAAQEVWSTQGYGGDGTNNAKHGGEYNGGGGGHGRVTNSPGAGAINGGGGGGGGGASQITGGNSLNGGDGGLGQASVVANADGQIPAGGGGGRYAGPDRPGHGARGQVEIVVF